ncbi:MAG: TIGR03768 family metallophosphoesterase [Pararhodobacter sp.]|nr:TIGR03768 family metallophosphoesterase [Pararhodobacter sp.]
MRSTLTPDSRQAALELGRGYRACARTETEGFWVMSQSIASDRPFAGGLGFLRRRSFLKSSAAFLGAASLGGFGASRAWADEVRSYPIDTPAVTTRERMLSFPLTLTPGLEKNELHHVSRYGEFGYGEWTFGSGLPVMERLDLMPAGYVRPDNLEKERLLRFFSFADVHITDKEAPNQLILFQQIDPVSHRNTSIYSPVMPYTTQVLDVAVQTVNDLHRRDPFDFGITLGDACNDPMYNATRWFIDVLDGKVITPSSGAHVGADSIDYQMPFQAAGLDSDIPWYMVLGNHDHFFIGSFPLDAEPSLGLRESYTADSVWAAGSPIRMEDFSSFPPVFDYRNLRADPLFYPGVLNGTTTNGDIVLAGSTDDLAFGGQAPRVVPDPDRRPLVPSEWMDEFFNTTSHPVGHGFNLIDRDTGNPEDAAFACYSFVPKAEIPLKIIVLDVTQSSDDGSFDIHGHGYLDSRRLEWLQAELDSGQANNQLMIIAAHIPIGVSPIGSHLEWWAGDENTKPGYENAVDLEELVAILQGAPNLLMWLAGHRHFNVVKAFPSADTSRPEQGFWQVETSSLRDFPQQFRSYEVYLNSDYTVSIEAVNVDVAVAGGTPAAQSRKFAIAAQQIIQNDIKLNSPNFATVGGHGTIPVLSMDPTRPQSDDPTALDPSIRYEDLSTAEVPVPYHASCNAELVKPLSPEMVAHLRQTFAFQN